MSAPKDTGKAGYTELPKFRSEMPPAGFEPRTTRSPVVASATEPPRLFWGSPAIKRYNHAVTWATRHFISLISISKKYESNFKEISKLHLLVVIYECTSGHSKRPCLKCITQLGDSLMFEQIDFSSSSSYSQFDVGSMFDYIRLHVARFVHCLSRQSLFFDIIPHYVQPPSL